MTRPSQFDRAVFETFRQLASKGNFDVTVLSVLTMAMPSELWPVRPESRSEDTVPIRIILEGGSDRLSLKSSVGSDEQYQTQLAMGRAWTAALV
jgi:hypothetical protein